ncbi:MAG: hypothetical protein KDA58_11645 [Planctomycetaceae bacterium]|nr:hypothetical protein [Planctomycetaceae bacterium]
MRYLILGTLLLSVCTLSGCTQRREALGGGGRSRTSVKVIRAGGGVGNEGGGESGGEMITTFGDFRGRITVTGTAPQLAPLVRKGDASIKDDICKAEDVPNETVLVGPGGGLANVFVFLRRAPNNVEIPPVPEAAVSLDQKGCKFVPHASIVRVGQPIQLLNSDTVPHNVKGKGLSFTINKTVGPQTDASAAPVEKATRRENAPAEIGCDFHTWMRGWVLPLDHPWSGLTNESGEFEIKGVPAGEMEFVVFHEGKQLGAFNVTISPDAPVEETMEVDASKLAGN